MQEEYKSPPKTVQEIGIHLGYMRDTLEDIKLILKDTPTRKEVDAIEQRVALLEDGKETILREAREAHEYLEQKAVSKTEFRIGVTTITVALSVIIAIITIWNNIKEI